MCGIAGELSLDGAPVKPEAIAAMSDAIIHRGPDSDGLHCNGRVALASRRLAIRDLTDAGHMPMHDPESGLVLVYNGEIYNSPELRRQLVENGESFRSTGDTEVLLKLLRREGPNALPRLRGMFAFACWDSREQTLLIARDHYGIKPLYLYRNRDRLLFASEIKAILRHGAVTPALSPEGLADYFVMGHTITPHTMFEGIEKLPAGSYLATGAGRPPGGILAGDCGGEPVQYWDPLELRSSRQRRRTATDDELQQQLLATFEQSVERHLLSDVPVGVFLSGGLDSSAIAAIAARASRHRLQTFTVGFSGEGSVDERLHARRVARALDTAHHELELTDNDLATAILPMVRHLDEPPGDDAMFPTYALSKAIGGQVKVILSGDGADEMFGGYRRYAADRWLARLSHATRQLPLASAARVFAPRSARLERGLAALAIRDPVQRGLALQWPCSRSEAAELLAPEWHGALDGPLQAYRCHHDAAAIGPDSLDRIDTLLYADQKLRMSDGYCEKVDRTTMAASLESRVPFIDVEVGRLAATLPSELKVNGFQLKYLLRKSLGGVLPRETLERPKRGFTVPLDGWLRGALRPLVEEVLRPDVIARRGVLRESAVRDLVHSREDVSTRLWLVLGFELWCQEHLD